MTQLEMEKLMTVERGGEFYKIVEKMLENEIIEADIHIKEDTFEIVVKVTIARLEDGGEVWIDNGK